MVNRMTETRSTKVVAVRLKLASVAVLEQAADKAGLSVPELVKRAVAAEVARVLGGQHVVQARLAAWNRDHSAVNQQEEVG